METHELADMVEDELNARGMTRYELGVVIGHRSRQAVYRLLDRKPITLTNALKIMDALGIRVVPPTAKERRELARVNAAD